MLHICATSVGMQPSVLSCVCVCVCVCEKHPTLASCSFRVSGLPT